MTACAELPGRCAVCDGTSARVVWRENGYEGRACACGTVYTVPAPVHDVVDPTIDGHLESYYAAPARRRVRWLVRHRPRGRLLEIGCGEGHLLVAARAAGYGVAGLEPDPARARRAAARAGVPVACALLETWRPDGARFDIVYHCDLLSHFAEPVAALRTMTGLLAPGGVLAFEVGLLGGIAPHWYRRLGTLGYPQHRWLYSEDSLRMLLARADLTLTHSTRFGLGLGILFVDGIRSLARAWRWCRPAGRALVPAPAGASVLAGRLVEGTEAFWRYRAGRLAPRLGPATLLAIATPRAKGSGR
jgi:SAM-dependent methyltransferase